MRFPSLSHYSPCIGHIIVTTFKSCFKFVIECFEMINEHVVNLYVINHTLSLFVRLFRQHTGHGLYRS